MMSGAGEIQFTLACICFHSRLQQTRSLQKQKEDRKGRRGIGRAQISASIASGRNRRRQRLSMDRSKIGLCDRDLRYVAAGRASCFSHIFVVAPRVRVAPELESDRRSLRYQSHAKLERFVQPQRFGAQ